MSGLFRTAIRLWGMPIILGVITAAGLLAALVFEGSAPKLVVCFALAILLGTIGVFALRR